MRKLTLPGLLYTPHCQTISCAEPLIQFERWICWTIIVPHPCSLAYTMWSCTDHCSRIVEGSYSCPTCAYTCNTLNGHQLCPEAMQMSWSTYNSPRDLTVAMALGSRCELRFTRGLSAQVLFVWYNINKLWGMIVSKFGAHSIRRRVSANGN